jgi:hypothetical protein
MNTIQRSMLLAALFATGIAVSTTPAQAARQSENPADTLAETEAETQTDDSAEVEVAPGAAPNAPNASNGRTGQPVELPSGLGDFCFFAHLPPADQKYTVVKKLKVGKGTYGGVTDILPKLAENTRSRGADAIIEYGGAQHFGFWPWRMVRPVVHGIAVKWTGSAPVNCEAAGGTTLSTILSTNLAPEK